MVQETLSQRLLQLKKEKNFNKNPNKPQLEEMPACIEAIRPAYLPYVHQQKAFERPTGDDGTSLKRKVPPGCAW